MSTSRGCCHFLWSAGFLQIRTGQLNSSWRCQRSQPDDYQDLLGSQQRAQGQMYLHPQHHSGGFHKSLFYEHDCPGRNYSLLVYETITFLGRALHTSFLVTDPPSAPSTLLRSSHSPTPHHDGCSQDFSLTLRGCQLIIICTWEICLVWNPLSFTWIIIKTEWSSLFLCCLLLLQVSLSSQIHHRWNC